MTNLRLLSLDFDGTMIAPWESEPATVSQPLVDHLNLLRRHGTIIAMNTGRTLELVDKALKFFPFRPDYALTTEREIYRAKGSGWEPIAEWNEDCQQSHDQLYRDASELLADIESYLSNRTQVTNEMAFTSVFAMPASTRVRYFKACKRTWESIPVRRLPQVTITTICLCCVAKLRDTSHVR